MLLTIKALNEKQASDFATNRGLSVISTEIMPARKNQYLVEVLRDLDSELIVRNWIDEDIGQLVPNFGVKTGVLLYWEKI